MKRTLFFVASMLLAALALTASAQTPPPADFAVPYTISSAVTTVTASSAARGLALGKTYQARGITSAGAGSATVNIEGSNDGTSWDVIGTMTMTLSTTPTTGSFTSLDRYVWVRMNVTALSGTGASISALMGY